MKIVKFWFTSVHDEQLVGVISDEEKDKVTAKFITHLDGRYGVSNIVTKGDEVRIHWTDGEKCVSVLKFVDFVVNDFVRIDEIIKTIR